MGGEEEDLEDLEGKEEEEEAVYPPSRCNHRTHPWRLILPPLSQL